MKNNDVIQLILSLRNEFAAMRYTIDDEQNNTVSRFFEKIQNSGKSLEGDEKILYDILKDTFVIDYYNVSFWGMEMTDINSGDLSQIETWSKLDFKNYLSESFRKNESKEQELRKLSLEKYKALFRDDHKDIAYYNTLQEWYLTRKIHFLSDSDFFTKHELKENQTGINALYDRLIAENEGNVKLYFMHEKLLHSYSSTDSADKPEQLQALLESDTEGDYKALIMSDIMSFYRNNKKWEEALAIADQAKKQFPESSFLEEIRYRADELTNPSLGISYEEQTQSNRPIHIVAEHRNISDFVLSIYEVSGDFKPFLEYTKDYYSKGIFYDKIEKKLIRKEHYRLPESKIYEERNTSLEIQPLPPGLYIAEFSLQENPTGDTGKNFFFTVSDHKIIYNRKGTDNVPREFRLVNSENGKPVPDKDLVFFELIQDKDLVKLYAKTDEKGIFKIPSRHNHLYRSYLIHQPETNDFQVMNIYGQEETEDPNDERAHKTAAQIFTDRAIYRPGQTLYFKVINTRADREKESTLSGIQQKIILLDANYQEISSREFTTSEFGSYSGSFILPKGKLNGTFFLKTEGGAESYRYFKVEEYKRPRFEIRFEPVKEEYQYGQTLELKGKAVMFSGTPLSNVTVQYEISKNNIRWKYFSRYSKDRTSESTVLGEATTDARGEFIIPVTFEKNTYLEGIQIDRFEVEASVTDINGETQSASTGLNVSSVSYYLKAEEIKDTFNHENLKIKVETKTYNDQHIQKSYHVRLSRLTVPDRILRSNFSKDIQDLPLFSGEEFIRKFPHDLYGESEDRKVETVITDQVHQSAELDLGRLETGKYKLELYDIQETETIKTSQYFNVWDKNILTENIFLNVADPEKSYLRGEKAEIYVYSAIPGALVNIFIQNGLGNTVSEVKELKNGVLKYIVEIPQDKAISALNIQFQMVAYNDVQLQTVKLKIKEDENPLSIETTTFRDHIEPGSKEKWSVKVSGKDREKINAEVLAGMYDRSLDQFAANTFTWEKLDLQRYPAASYNIRQSLDSKFAYKALPYVSKLSIRLPYFNWYDGDLPGHITFLGGSASSGDGMVLNEIATPGIHKKIAGGSSEKERGVSAGSRNKNTETIPVRQNLNETAFFYPDLKTDSEGNISFEFTSPEALTQWKLMILAHTRDARAATLEKEVITRKEFSVTPNYPRFLREGDELNFLSKLSNLTDRKLNGYAELQILDAFTHEDISAQFGLDVLTAVSGYNKEQAFSLNENGNSVVAWKLKVPEHVSSVIIKVVAKAGQYSDGEQKALAVLPNRVLVTDSIPIFVKEGETRTFVLDNLENAASATISNVSNTLELTTNPIWEIMFAFPGLKNDQNNSADVIFNKWFADVLASEIFKSDPGMKNVFEAYQEKGLLSSELENNMELKQLLLEETPWVLESKNEDEQMHKLALLWDADTMKNSISQGWEDLRKRQNSDGGFSWYQGSPSSYSISLYILRNLGKISTWLKDKWKDEQHPEQEILIENLIGYADREISRYSDIQQENIWSNRVIDYLDTRNYWEKQYPLEGNGAVLKALIKQKTKDIKITDLTFFGVHRLALLMNDYGLKDVSDRLINYLKETSVASKTQGIYWKQNLNGWGWFSSKIINHAGVLEAFNTLRPDDEKFIEDLKIWLITQKEVNSWGSSRGTAEVIFTLLNSGKSWAETESNGPQDDQTVIVWGGKEPEARTQVTGYVKSIVKTDILDKKLATATITKNGPGMAQGGLFWQYYEDADAVKSSENYISITRELYKKIKTENGAELQEITSKAPLKAGDKVTVRMILNTDRPMEFIRIRDMRAAGFEPVDVLSGYQWKNNLGYYQSTGDSSTNFYIQYMPKGKYVFEYDLIANVSGTFSNGITTMQNYYAPQMNAHTKGGKVEIN